MRRAGGGGRGGGGGSGAAAAGGAERRVGGVRHASVDLSPLILHTITREDYYGERGPCKQILA